MMSQVHARVVGAALLVAALVGVFMAYRSPFMQLYLANWALC